MLELKLLIELCQKTNIQKESMWLHLENIVKKK